MTDLASDQVELLLDGARYGDAEDVTTALDVYRVSPDIADDRGRTALHMASANGHSHIVQLLLHRGADPIAENAEGNTPLHWACLNGRDEVVSLLMRNGADPSALNRSGRTPVDEALGGPHQGRILAAVNAFGKATTELDETNDPEKAAEAAEEIGPEQRDPALRVYDKYGGSKS